MKTVFPEDLKALSNDELVALQTAGLAEFDANYSADFATLSDEAVDILDQLTTGLSAVAAEFSARNERTAKLAAMAGKRDELATITINSGTLNADIDSGDDSGAADSGSATPGVGDDTSSTIVAASDRDPAANFAGAAAPKEEPIVAYSTGEGLGLPADSPMDWDKLGAALDKRLSAFNVTPYQQAAATGRVLKTTASFAVFKQNVPESQIIPMGGSHGAVRKAIEAARDQTKLKGGSLIASGGWGAPSDISYDRFPKLSSQDGLATWPVVQVQHGGLQMPHGSDFATIFASPDYISFTEAQDIAGDYVPGSGAPLNTTGNTAGAKPVYRIPPTTWVDERLRVDGIHIQAGILENRGYPEGISEEVAMVMDAHVHLINAKKLAVAQSGSTGITMTAGQLGAVAPILRAIELQAIHYRDSHRMALNTVLEAKFPLWVVGAIRDDLAKRQFFPSNPFEITDAMITSWFQSRGISVEFVYDWQSVAGTAANAFTLYPASVSFLLYAAGTWVEGTSDVISLDTMYDSTLLGTNDYTVLFTEQGWFLHKAGPDSRFVTVSISPTGVANIGAEIAATGAGSYVVS